MNIYKTKVVSLLSKAAIATTVLMVSDIIFWGMIHITDQPKTHLTQKI